MQPFKIQNVSRAIKSGVFTSMAMIGFRSEISASQHAEAKWRKFIVCTCRNKVLTHSFETDRLLRGCGKFGWSRIFSHESQSCSHSGFFESLLMNWICGVRWPRFLLPHNQNNGYLADNKGKHFMIEEIRFSIFQFRFWKTE